MREFKELKNNILGNPVRLGIMIYLLPRQKALFKDILSVLEITPGNLDSHLKTLEKCGYVEISKVFRDRPRTMIRIMEKGIEETNNYLKILKRILRDNE